MTSPSPSRVWGYLSSIARECNPPWKTRARFNEPVSPSVSEETKDAAAATNMTLMVAYIESNWIRISRPTLDLWPQQRHLITIGKGDAGYPAKGSQKG